jgi:hypothetical protein
MTPAEWKRRIEAIEEAMRRALSARLNLRFINDPEEGLDRYRDRPLVSGHVDHSMIGEWYAAYQAASLAGDEARALHLLRRGAAALHQD